MVNIRRPPVPYEHRDVILAQHNKLIAERARVVGEYEEARLGEYADAVMYAADKLTEIDAKIGALNQIANNLVASQQQAQPQNKYGLSKDEVAVARGIGGGDPKLTNDDRERIYAENRAKYQRMRATGEYRDDQGSVRR
jgi:mitochondrial fission protein ELM1